MTRRSSPRRWQRPQSRRRWLLPASGALVAIAVAGALLSWLFAFRSDGPAGPPKAAIVDQLSLTVPNQEFRKRATDLLEQAGYAVDYYPGEEVNVAFYRELPDKGYEVILFRSHADRLEAEAGGKRIDEVILFTGEPYDEKKYVSSQAANELVIARYYAGGEPYFGIAPGFLNKGLGDFDGATIVMMGCEGLLSTGTAEAFVNLGAETYISWDETVSASHTDAATEVLLQHLLIERKPPDEAVALTMLDVGPDPVFGSRLRAYPSDS